MDAVTIDTWHLPYVTALAQRLRDDVTTVVIHCTELPDLAMARTYGEKILYVDTGTGNSGHFYIDRDGRVFEYVPIERVAHHTRGYNPQSVGIELVNRGRYPDWMKSTHQAMDEPYTEAQITSLRSLLAQLRAALPNLVTIAGHEELDTTLVPSSDDPDVLISRKRDPGPLFPWDRVLEGFVFERVSQADREHHE